MARANRTDSKAWATACIVNHTWRHRTAWVVLSLGMAAFVPQTAFADEGGVSFRLPGQYGSLAATPAQLGWSIASTYYHASVSGDARIDTAREIRVGRFNPTVDISLNGTL